LRTATNPARERRIRKREAMRKILLALAGIGALGLVTSVTPAEARHGWRYHHHHSHHWRHHYRHGWSHHPRRHYGWHRGRHLGWAHARRGYW
jgi:hypothetical protein